MKPILCASLLLLFLAAACSKPEEPAPSPSSLKPSSAHGGGMAAGPSKGGLKFSAPSGWVSEPPKSAMRKAQYRLPRAQGDPEDAELVVFYFQGSGGGVQANIDRWIDQFTKADGSPVQDAQTSKKEVHGIPLTLVDVSGTYKAASGPMLSEVQDKPNYRMLGAVAESSTGPWFFKLTGPARTVAHWEPSFRTFVDSISE